MNENGIKELKKLSSKLDELEQIREDIDSIRMELIGISRDGSDINELAGYLRFIFNHDLKNEVKNWCNNLINANGVEL